MLVVLAAPAALASEVPTDASICTWPQCTTKCGVGCNYRPVGTCVISLVAKSWPACDADSTECFLGKCLCKEGFCASEDEESCVPQGCVQGATAPPYEPTDWVSTFYALASSDSFPPPGTMIPDPIPETLNFLQENALWPAVLVGVGLVVGLLTFVCLFCSPAVGVGRELMVSPRPLIAGSGSQRYAQLAKGGGQDEPSVWPMLSVAGFTLAVNLILIIGRCVTYTVTTGIADETGSHLLRDVTTVADMARMINHTVRTLEYQLEVAPWSCGAVPDSTREMLSNRTSSALNTYCDQVEDYYKQVEPLPDKIQQALDLMHQGFPWLKWGPLLPVILMTVVSAFMVLEAFLTQKFGTSTLAREEDCAMHIASGLLFLVILFVAVISAAEVAVGIGASLFCRNVDENVLSYVDYYLTNKTGMSAEQSGMVLNLTTFYINGSVPSPLAIKAVTLRKYVSAIYQYYNTSNVKDNRDAPGSVCPALSDISPSKILLPVKYTLRNITRLLKASNIYPYYDGVVHQVMCGSVVATLGWTVVTQAIVGLVCFPACAVLTHRFLSSWAVWKANEESDDEDHE